MAGVLIGNKHTEKDWGLNMVDSAKSSPNVKRKTVDIPGMDGVIDLTESLTGQPQYENRLLTFSFKFIDRDIEKYQLLSSEIKNYCHGRIMKVVEDTDNTFYWMGRVKVDDSKVDQIHSIFTITVEVNPYKYDIYSSTEDWLWDPFNFDTDVAREYKNLVIDGTRDINLLGSLKPINPEVTASADMVLIFEGREYPVKAGTSKIYEITLAEGLNPITVKGIGMITFDIRGGSF